MNQRELKYLNKDGFEEQNINIYRSLEMRYVGQIHECTVNIDFFEITNETLKNIKEAFHNRAQRTIHLFRNRKSSRISKYRKYYVWKN